MEAVKQDDDAFVQQEHQQQGEYNCILVLTDVTSQLGQIVLLSLVFSRAIPQLLVTC